MICNFVFVYRYQLIIWNNNNNNFNINVKIKKNKKFLSACELYFKKNFRILINFFGFYITVKIIILIKVYYYFKN